ncbi:MAG: thioredoxin [Gammaproteobacteria bacterium]|nr:thioredoxin family protein [Gemmatimonadota bacterium]NIU79027.1 thioredoxin [Gammaproteobacteria bacterium]
MEGVAALVIALAGATAYGLWHRWAAGRARERPADRGIRLTAEDLGHELGDRVTLVQFSTAFCQPCRANRQVLRHVAASTDGAVHVDIDAESNLDLVRRLGVTRTPVTFVLDAEGAVRRRASGALRLHEARTAAALPENEM